MGEIVFKHVSKSYADKAIYSDFSLTLRDKEITCFVGASGCGKTTILRMLARLTPYSGEIQGQGICAPVFQESRLIPSLTVTENLRYVCDDPQAVAQMLQKVELSEAAHVYPRALSGGMSSRVAMARAFLLKRDTLLLDEPFRALDVGLKERLFSMFRSLMEGAPCTTVFVTHDVGEAVAMAHRIIILDKGNVRKEFRNTPSFSLERRNAVIYDEMLKEMLTL